MAARGAGSGLAWPREARVSSQNQAGLGLVREVGRGSQGRGEQRESHEARWPGLGWGWG